MFSETCKSSNYLVDNHFTAHYEMIFAVIDFQFAVIGLHFAVIDLQFAVIDLQFVVIILQFAVIDLQFAVINLQNVCLLWNDLQPNYFIRINLNSIGCISSVT